MKIAIDGEYLQGNIVGIGKYVKYLSKYLSSLDLEIIIFYSHQPTTKISGKRIESIILETNNRFIFEQVLIPMALINRKVDLYHAVGNVGVPIFCPIPSVLTVQDLIPILWKDFFSFSKYPILSKWLYLFRLKTSLFKANKIITTSNFVKLQLVNNFNISQKKITVVKLGLEKNSETGQLPKELKGQKYILNNGGIGERKNLERLITAFGSVIQDFPNLKLVITGENAFLEEKLKKLLRKLNLERSVRFTGYLEEKTLNAVIKSSECICYPSLSEGFGLPILEGFITGIPVISSKSSAIPEISGNAAILIDPTKISEISGAIRKVLTDQSMVRVMIKNGKKIADKYNWSNTAKETLEVYKRLL